MNYYGLSFIGRRKENQDSIASVCLDSERGIYIFAIADGMGGATGGGTASNTVIKTLIDYLQDFFDRESSKPDLKDLLRKAIEEADRALEQLTSDDDSLRGMGTTLSCVLIHENSYVVGNIGDSRTYSYDRDYMQQITRDHSNLQEYREQYGENLDPELVQQYGHGVTKVLQGYGDKPDIFPLDREAYELMDNTGFLICSDGLLVNKAETDPEPLHQYCLYRKNLKHNVEQLISYAFHEGSTDNISVICAEYGKVPKTARISRKLPYPPQENHSLGCKLTPVLLLGAPIIIIIGILATLILTRTPSQTQAARLGEQHVEQHVVQIMEKNAEHHEDMEAGQMVVELNPEKANEKQTIRFINSGFYPRFSVYPHNLAQEGSILLSWQTEPGDFKGLSFQIDLAGSSDMSQPRQTFTGLNSIEITGKDMPNSLPQGILYWQVRAIKDSQEVCRSKVQKIRVIR